MPSLFQKSPLVTFRVGKAHFGQQVTVGPGLPCTPSVLLEGPVSFQINIPVASTEDCLSCLCFLASLLMFSVPTALLLSVYFV